MSASWSDTLQPDVGVIIAAAGQGERLGGSVPKQFQPIAGVPMVLRAIRPFLAHPAVVEVVVVLPPDRDGPGIPPWLADLCGDRLRVVAGGATRTESVAEGLRVLSPTCSVVLVHDGARPFPDPDVISTVIEVARRGQGAVAAVPVTDTLKEAEPSETERRVPSAEPRVVIRTLPRTSLWRAQTPQGFPRALLEQAYARARAERTRATDDAALIERIGGKVLLIRDSAINLKVTDPDDLQLAEALARGLSGGG
ncbi:MAG: 2-C-methyl-D-erythritol 4-phosphate cytidylyltransferase [Gemmatimonadales bacterium]